MKYEIQGEWLPADFTQIPRKEDRRKGDRRKKDRRGSVDRRIKT